MLRYIEHTSPPSVCSTRQNNSKTRARQYIPTVAFSLVAAIEPACTGRGRHEAAAADGQSRREPLYAGQNRIGGSELQAIAAVRCALFAALNSVIGKVFAWLSAGHRARLLRGRRAALRVPRRSSACRTSTSGCRARCSPLLPALRCCATTTSASTSSIARGARGAPSPHRVVCLPPPLRHRDPRFYAWPYVLRSWRLFEGRELSAACRGSSSSRPSSSSARSSGCRVSPGPPARSS